MLSFLKLGVILQGQRTRTGRRRKGLGGGPDDGRRRMDNTQQVVRKWNKFGLGEQDGRRRNNANLAEIEWEGEQHLVCI